MSKYEIIIWCALAFLVGVIANLYYKDGKFIISDADKKHYAERELQEWKETPRGVRYFYDCIDGNKFIVTGAGHGKVLAGPVGKCEVES